MTREQFDAVRIGDVLREIRSGGISSMQNDRGAAPFSAIESWESEPPLVREEG